MNKANIFPLSDITIGTRQRKYFNEGKIIDLAEDIKIHGLIHAPVITPEGEIIAGERRLKAMQLLHRRGDEFKYQGEIIPLDSIPVSIMPVDNPLVDAALWMKEIELAENLLRENLTWQEEVQAKKELHELRLKTFGPKHTVTDTAREIKGEEPTPQDAVVLKEDMFLAQSLEDPDIAKIKNKKDAMRAAKERMLAQKRSEMREQFKIDISKSKSPHTALLGSMEEKLSSIPSFDLLLTDPPYGVDASEFNSQFAIGHDYEDSSSDWPQLMTTLAELSFIQAKPKAHAFVFCSDVSKWTMLASIFTAAGWDVWSRPLVWDKGSLGSLPRPKHGPRFCYELILFASKGDKEVLKNGRDVLPIPTGSKSYHAAEKPVDLYVELIQRCCHPGEIVVDPFCGSGTIFPAASRAAVKAFGIEKNPTHYDTTLQRLAESH